MDFVTICAIASIILWGGLGIFWLFINEGDVDKIVFGITWATLMINLVVQAVARW